jgi:DNA-binding transcriptional LysR family regulator
MLINENLRKIRIEYLYSFRTLVRLKSFSETAIHLKKTQSAISQQLEQLETLLGTKLIVRTSKSFEITEQGRIVQEALDQIFNLFSDMEHKLIESSQHPQQKVTIASSSIPGEYILPQIISEFRKLHSYIDFEIRISNSKEAFQEINNETVTFAAVGGFHHKSTNDFDLCEIGTDQVVIVARKDHPIFKIITEVKRSDKNSTDQDILDIIIQYPWIFREDGSATIDWFFESIPIKEKLKIGLELHNNTAILNALEKGDALTVLSNIILKSLGSPQKFQAVQHPNLPVINRQLFLVKMKQKSLSQAEELFWNFVNDLFQVNNSKPIKIKNIVKKND